MTFHSATGACSTRRSPTRLPSTPARASRCSGKVEEFGENYVLPGSGTTRIQIRRDVHWEYFYDDFGSALIRVYRRLARLRGRCRALRSRNSFYFNDNSNLAVRAIAYSRRAGATATEPEQVVMVFLNFSDSDQSLTVPFPVVGTYREMLDDDIRGSTPLEISITSPGQSHTVPIPPNYGQVYVTPVLTPL